MVVGALLVVAILLDVLVTTLTFGQRAGPITRRLVDHLWRWLRRLRPLGSRSRLLANAGPALLVLTVLVWVVGTWAGWWLVFLGGGAVEAASTGAPASAGDVAYYAGFSVFTLGTGDFVADSPTWRNLTALASFGGLVLITLAITYLLSVVSAVVTRRALAGQIRALGSSAGEVVALGWAGGAFGSAFVQHLVTVTGVLSTVVEQHVAYPVLHYFRSRSPQDSAPVAIALLDDALFLLEAAVADGAAPEAAAVRPARAAIERWLATLGETGAEPARDGAPPAPSVAPLRAAGIPLRPREHLERQLARETGRRCSLQRLVHEAGWLWPGAGRRTDASAG
jgi:hypothetical protein